MTAGLPSSSSNTPLPVDLEREAMQELARMEDYRERSLEGDDESENLPPLPREPPPSSSSESSRTNSQDFLSSPERDAPLPHIGSETSFEDWQTDSSSAIIAPPDHFVGSDSPSKHPQTFSYVMRVNEVEEEEEEKEEEEDIREAMHSSTPKLFESHDQDTQAATSCLSPTLVDGFRRARSNPSISGSRVVMSVIASPTTPACEKHLLSRASSEDFNFSKPPLSPTKKIGLTVSATKNVTET